MINVPWKQVGLAVAGAMILGVVFIMVIYDTVQVNTPDQPIKLDDATATSGRLPIFQIKPDTALAGCLFSNGTHYFTGDCLGGIGIINLTNISLFSGLLPVWHGGTGTNDLPAGIVKSGGGNLSLFTTATLDLPSEVTGVLPATHGGLGTGALAAGFAKSPGAGLPLVSAATVDLLTEVTHVLQVPNGGSGAPTFTAGFLRAPGGAAAFITTTTVNVTNETVGVLPPAHGGLGHATFGQGYLFATGADDFVSTLPIPSAHLDAVLTDKTLMGETLLPDATSDALLYVSSGGFLSGVRYAFTDTDFVLSASGTNPVTIQVSLNVTDDVLDVAHGGTGLSSLVTGSLLYASGTSTFVLLAPASAGNVLLAGASPSWGQVGLTTHVTGVLPAVNGGTGLASYVVGDLLVASTSTTLARLPDVALGKVLISGGVGQAPLYDKVNLTFHVNDILPLGSGGTGVGAVAAGGLLYATSSTTALSVLAAAATGNVLLSGTAPSWGKVDLALHTTGTLDLATQVTGILSVSHGGTGIGATYTIGDLLVASASNTLVALSDVAPGSVLLSGGLGASPSYGKVGLTTHVSGILPSANGGTGFGTGNTYTAGDMLYASSTTTLARVPTASANNVLHSNGAGAPTWGPVDLAAEVTGILNGANGGTGFGTAIPYVVGDILYASTTTALGKVAAGGSNKVLLSSSAAPTWGQVPLTTHVTGILPQANGGTGFATYAVGDILYADTTSSLATLASGVANRVLHSNGDGAPTWGQVALATEVSGLLPSANGGTGFGTGNLYTAGDMLYASSTTTLSRVPTAAANNVLHSNAAGAPTWGPVALGSEVSGILTAAFGGTGFGTAIPYTVGDILYASTTTALGKLAAAATGNALISAGTGTAPAWGKIDLTLHVSGLLPSASGGTGFGTGNTYTAGDMLYASTTTTLSRVPTAAAGNVLHSNAAGAPTWGPVALASEVSGLLPSANGGTGFGSGNLYTAGDMLYASTTTALSRVPTAAANNVLHSNAAGAPTWGKVDLAAEVSGILTGAFGGTGFGTAVPYVVGDILYASTTTALSKLAAVATGNALISGGTGTAPSWGKIDLTAHVSGLLPSASGGTGFGTGNLYVIGDILYASSTTLLSKLAGVATGNALISGGTGTAPSWGKIALTTHVSGLLPSANGGTGFGTGNLYVIGDLLYASSTTLLSKLAAVATGKALISAGTGTAPAWGQIDISTTIVTGTLAQGNGGTGFATYTTGDMLYASATNTLSKLTAVATGKALISKGTSTAPAWGQIDVSTSIVTGVLDVVNGGTGASSFTAGFLISLGGTPLQTLATIALNSASGLVTNVLDTVNGGTGQSTYTNGQLLIGSTTTGSLVKATLTAGLGFAVTNAPGAITVDSTHEWYFLYETQAANTNGGAASGTGFLARTLTSSVTSPSATGLVSLSSNVFTLGPGTYMVNAWSSAYNATAAYTARLAITLNPSGAILWGVGEHGLAGQAINPKLFGKITVASNTGYFLKMAINKFGSNTDYGLPINDGNPEFYTMMYIVKVN